MAEKIATRQAYGETLAALGEKDENIVVLDADLSGSTMTKMFASKFPDRFFNVGIAEQNLYGYAS
jgi:transketolase